MNTNVFRKIWVSLLGCVSLFGVGQVQMVQAEELNPQHVNNNLKSNTTFTQGDFTYTVVVDGVKLSKFSSSSDITDVNIPDSVSYNGVKYPVVWLDDSCFLNCINMKSVKIPSQVTRLGMFCFSGCSSLTSVEFSSGINIFGSKCFLDCVNLKSIYIPDGDTFMDDYCFYNCIYNHRTTKTNQKYPSVNL